MEYEGKNSLLQREKTLFQLRFVKKMNDLIVSNDDVTQRIAISAYVISLLDDDERHMLLYKLDELEGRMIRINKPFSFDFNNAMGYFLDLSKGLDEQEEARFSFSLDFYRKVLERIWYSGFADHEEIYSDMYSKLDEKEKTIINDEWDILKNELLVKFGEDDQYHNIYNTILFYQNKVEGTETDSLEYVTLSFLTSNVNSYKRFLPMADDASVDSSGVDSSCVEPDTVESNENAIRQEATKQLEFYQEVLVAAMANEDDDVLLDSAMSIASIEMINQVGYEESIRIQNGMIEVREILLPLGEDEEYHNWYNVMTYFENIAKGKELEYVSSSVLVHNLDMLKRFLPHDYDAEDDDNDKDNISNVNGDEPSIISRIEASLIHKPHPDLNESWKWADLNNDMLIDVCEEVLLPLSRPDRYTRRRLRFVY